MRAEARGLREAQQGELRLGLGSGLGLDSVACGVSRSERAVHDATRQARLGLGLGLGLGIRLDSVACGVSRSERAVHDATR